ncbi:asparaginase [Clostridium fermenticellae]|uniref:asparaginase n=1 Tax=Clostridium fermenticellae TaxID=2068654 RepID=A0A386H0Y8_9CLOT|nr:asparaginase [Clostridium fermenticellae]AYD39306.1 asparaginase [Clostridium fermenticellae]
MKRVIVIFTGGTISMKKNESNRSMPSMSGEDILKIIPGIDEAANVDCMDFSKISGQQMPPEKMFELSGVINKKIKNGGYDGIVVTHGTDSIEETAYLVDLTYNESKPVVFVGAMKISSDPGWDGAGNLIDAVKVAASDDARSRGVMLVMNKEIHVASQVTKTNTCSLNTFRSLDFGPIGYVDNGKPYFYYKYTKRQYIDTDKIDTKVDLIKTCCGMDDKMLKFCIDSGSHGIIIEGMGRGNIPPKMVRGVEYAIEKNVPVVLVSRCISGKVTDDYGDEGSGGELREKGVIFGDNLPGQKARIKLMAALGYTKNVAEIKKIFEENYY